MKKMKKKPLHILIVLLIVSSCMLALSCNKENITPSPTDTIYADEIIGQWVCNRDNYSITCTLLTDNRFKCKVVNETPFMITFKDNYYYRYQGVTDYEEMPFPPAPPIDTAIQITAYWLLGGDTIIPRQLYYKVEKLADNRVLLTQNGITMDPYSVSEYLFERITNKKH